MHGGRRVLGTLAVIAVLAACSHGADKSGTPTTTVPPATRVVTVNPFAADGMKVTRTTTGTCTTPSSGDAARADAYRCSGTTILDPCFRDPARKQSYLLCPDSPVASKAVRVLPQGGLPTDNPSAAGATPWALVLGNGESCAFAQGGTDAKNTERLNYQCESGVIYGDPDRSLPVWSVHYEVAGSGVQMTRYVMTAYV
jgi:hypothetical protein